ncbi:hypothetical protein [Sphingomonas ginkgonis]|nr:hypothetical protein [Sphingomonas ginkgonis]
MPRGALTLVILLLVIIGGAFFLSRRAHEVPTRPIEVDVSSAPTR